MKKLLIPLFAIILFSCSKETFKPNITPPQSVTIYCLQMDSSWHYKFTYPNPLHWCFKTTGRALTNDELNYYRSFGDKPTILCAPAFTMQLVVVGADTCK